MWPTTIAEYERREEPMRRERERDGKKTRKRASNGPEREGTIMHENAVYHTSKRKKGAFLSRC